LQRQLLKILGVTFFALPSPRTWRSPYKPVHSSAQDLTTPTHQLCSAWRVIKKRHYVTRLQRAQNAAARVVVWGSRRRLTNSVGLLKQLHWVPVVWRIKFKIACITYKTISTTQPAYLYSSLKHYTPSPALELPFLTVAIRSSVSTYSFRRQLKTFLL